MSDVTGFALIVLLVAVVGLVAVLSSFVSRATRIPSPLIFLVAALVAVRVIPNLHAPPEVSVQRIVTVALVIILFTGGTDIGRRRFRAARGAILSAGLLGTLLTTAAVAVLAKYLLGVEWYQALLVAAAMSPTDPAVVFSVLGQREVAGRSGVILQGESGANDPVGIALMSSLLAAGGLTVAAVGHAALVFLGQMLIGGVLGILGARALLWFTRRFALPSESLYPLRTLACVFVLYGATTALEGSGFLAVFVAGILLGDERVPYQPETAGFFAALSSIAEIVVFIALGLTVDLTVLSDMDVWVPGLVIALVLTFVIRPVLVGLCLLPSRLKRNEATFVLFGGLKGAVPILLGTYLLTEHVPDGERLYEIVVTVVLFSVFVQGGLVPWVARVLRLPVRIVTPEPWSVRIRLENEPDSVQRLTVAHGSVAENRTIADLVDFPDDAWISLILRDQQLLPATGDATLRAGDQVVVLAHPRDHESVTRLFGRRT